MSTIDGTIGLSKLVQNASATQVVGAVVAILAIRWLARAFYRAYLHPLARFPGPKLSAATRIPQMVAIWTGKTHLYTVYLHKKYGPVVRISPDEVSFIDAQAWKDTSGHATAEQKKQRGTMPQKHWFRYGTTVNGVPNLINQRDDKEHARMRRIFNPAFSDRALKQQEPLFMKYVDMLVQKLKDGFAQDPNRKFDMVRMYNFTTFDVMGDLTFGESLHMLDQGQYDPWVSMIFGSIKFGNRLSLLMNYPWLYRIFKMLVPESFSRKRYEHFQHSVDRVTKRLEKGRESEGVDLWDLVLNQEEGKGLSRAEMDSNAGLFMIAGTETTATLVSGLTYQLLKNTEVMKKAVDEVRGTFSDSSEMSMESIATLPYLNACIKEALRVYPPVPIGLPRRTPPDGSTVAGVYVPPNTTVTIPHLAMYTNEMNFKDPMSFVPERWLGDERYAHDNRAALQPFSIGNRNCLGMNMAYHEMRLIMAKVLYNFDLELCPESDHWSSQAVFTLWEKVPLICKIKPVQAS